MSDGVRLYFRLSAVERGLLKYQETAEAFFSGLADQVELEEVSADDLLQDEGIRISECVFEGEVRVEPLSRYRVDDLGGKRAVYTFDHSLGIEVVGDYALM